MRAEGTYGVCVAAVCLVLSCFMGMAFGEGASEEMHIHLEIGFNGENVRILVDGKEFYSEQKVVTNYSNGLAAAAKGSVSKGDHEISLFINSKSKWSGSVTVAGPTYVGLSLRRILGFSFVTSRKSDKPFLYD